MSIEEIYSQVVAGPCEPTMILIPSPLGGVLVTPEGHFLLNDDGDIVGRVDPSYARDWFTRMAKGVH